jgi:hypothetical protein
MSLSTGAPVIAEIADDNPLSVLLSCAHPPGLLIAGVVRERERAHDAAPA